jgi:hypothetical protein
MVIKMASGTFTEGHGEFFCKGRGPLHFCFFLGKLADAI